ILVDSATGKARWLLDLVCLDAGLLENQWTDGVPSPKVIPLHARASQADQPAAIDAAHFALALTACNDRAARVELFGPLTRLAKSGRAIRNPSAQAEISVIFAYLGDERRFGSFLYSLTLHPYV